MQYYIRIRIIHGFHLFGSVWANENDGFKVTAWENIINMRNMVLLLFLSMLLSFVIFSNAKFGYYLVMSLNSIQSGDLYHRPQKHHCFPGLLKLDDENILGSPWKDLPVMYFWQIPNGFVILKVEL